MNITAIAPNLVQKQGIWYATEQEKVSFPDEGSAECMQMEDNSFWFKHRNQCIIELVQHFSPAQTFYDIGGGNGYVSLGLEQAKIPTVLVEPSEIGAFNAKKRGLTHIVCATLATAQFKPNSLENAGAFDVIEHIENDKEFVKMLHQYLKPSGKLYATVPAFNWLWSAEDDHAGHYRRYTQQNFNQLLQEAGFKVLHSTYIFSVLPLPIFLLRSLPSKFGNKKHELNTNKKEHSAGQTGFLAKLVGKIWQWELQKIKNLQSIGFGGSVLVVAEKV